jgi:hypothetical protein
MTPMRWVLRPAEAGLQFRECCAQKTSAYTTSFAVAELTKSAPVLIRWLELYVRHHQAVYLVLRYQP